MADITMCPGTGCPLKQDCRRYRAAPNEFWQSYSDFTEGLSTTDFGTVECSEFIEAWPHD